MNACPKCFEHFDVDAAAASFDAYYADSAEWKYFDVFPSERLCFNCADEEASSCWMAGDLEAANGPPLPGGEVKKLRKRLGF